jgi:hypothetical protein
MGHSISFEQVREYELSYSNPTRTIDESTPSEEVPPNQPQNDDDEETRVLTFAELQALLESGRVDLIPNNKVIPEVLNVNIFLLVLRFTNDSCFTGCPSQPVDGVAEKKTLGACRRRVNRR